MAGDLDGTNHGNTELRNDGTYRETHKTESNRFSIP